MAQGPDGDLYIGGLDLDRTGTGIVFRYTIPDLEVRAKREPSGIVTALKVSRSGRIFITGMRPDLKGYVASFEEGLSKVRFDQPFRTQSTSIGRALAINEDDSIWLAYEGDLPNPSFNLPLYYEDTGLPSLPKSIAVLQRIGEAGEITSERVIEYFRSDLDRSSRTPVALWTGPDGRLWCAIRGATVLPSGSDKGRSALETPSVGIVLRSLGLDGSLESDMTFLPGIDAQVSIGNSGRVAILSRERGIPLTSGAFGNIEDHKISVVAFNQRNAHEAPSLGSYHPVLNAEVLSVQSITKYAEAKTTLTSSASEPMEFVSGLISGNNEKSLGFEIVKIGPSIPTEVTIEPRGNYAYGAGLLALVPGAQGTLYIPLRATLSELSLTSFFDRGLSLPGPSSTLMDANLTARFFGATLDPELPFLIQSSEAWLTFTQTTAKTPATIPAKINPSGIAAGSSRTAVITFDFGSFQRQTRATLEVGPKLQIETPPAEYFVTRGQIFRHTLKVSSSGGPLPFAIQNLPDWLKISPMSGITPQNLEFTVDTKDFSLLSYTRGQYYLTSNNSTIVNAINYYALPEQELTPLERFLSREQAVGSLLQFSGGPARCDPTPLQPVPWPTSLGGCRIQIAGRPVPIGLSTEVKSPPSFRGSFLPTYDLLIQIPSDLPLGPTKMQVEDKEGRISTYDLILSEFVPKTISLSGDLYKSFTVRSGDTIRLSLTGLGTATQGSTRPTLLLTGNIGGRVARTSSPQMNPDLPAVYDVVLEIPTLLPGTYQVNLQVNEVILRVGTINLI